MTTVRETLSQRLRHFVFDVRRYLGLLKPGEPKFRVGDRVRDKRTGRLGVVLEVYKPGKP